MTKYKEMYYPVNKWNNEWNFVAEMNRVAYELNLKCIFANPHGMYHPINTMSCNDILTITKLCLNYPIFRDIVNCQKYTPLSCIKSMKEKRLTWTNTNSLLPIGYSGVKTGWIPNAHNQPLWCNLAAL
jgi:D-alanyl-D-alanine carboxypeptidase